MNPDDVLNTLTVSNGGIAPLASIGVMANAVNVTNVTTERDIESILDAYSMNRFVIDHKVTAQELMKLAEVAPDFAKEIKENIAKNLARDIAQKITYTKKHDVDTDVNHFIGRVWVFTDEEMKLLLKDKNVY